jgi:uncharacterized protein (TIGR02266 family)
VDSDRRKHLRLAWPQRCWCQASEISIYAQIGNVSEEGLFLRTPSPLSEGTAATLRLRLGADEAEQVVEAVVVWREDQRGMGLRFVSAPQGFEDRLRDLLRTLQQQ